MYVDVGYDIEVVVIEVLVFVVDELVGIDLVVEVGLDIVVGVDLVDLCFMGSCFGNVLYDVLENIDFVCWVGW